MRIEIFVTTFNNASIIQDFCNWYKDFTITAYDNESTDDTVEIFKQNNVNVISFSTNGKMSESKLMEIRNNCWKNSDADWVVVVDSDEFIKLNLEELSSEKFNIVKCKGYEIFGEGESFEKLRYGVESIGYSKPVVFKKDYFIDINLHPGSHSCSPVTKEGVQIVYGGNFPLYHTKWRSWEHGIGKAKELAPRVSEEDKLMGHNFHYGLDTALHLDYYEKGLLNRKLVRL